jgi:hypothetical protein
VYLAPTAGYFVADNLAVGVSLLYSNGHRKDERMFGPAGIAQRSETTLKQLRTGAFVQHHKMLTAQFGVTGRLGAGYQRQQEDGSGQTGAPSSNYEYTNSSTSSGYYADLTPGIVFFPVPRLGLIASLGALNFSNYKLNASSYSDTNGNTYTEVNKSESNLFNANFGLDAFLLGGTYYFGR